MNLTDLNKVALALAAPGKGILAADESSGTIKKRFDAIGVDSNPDSPRDYREMLFRSKEAMSKYISGVILYDESIWQEAKDGTPLVKLIEQAGAIPGIKVDEGTQALPKCPGAFLTVGLAGVADRTVRLLKNCVTAAVPGIAFLSGRQADEDATAHLDAMNRIGGLPWKLTFSYGRALQSAPQKAWSGKNQNVAAGQQAFPHRARMNSLASKGEWKSDLETKKAA